MVGVGNAVALGVDGTTVGRTVRADCAAVNSVPSSIVGDGLTIDVGASVAATIVGVDSATTAVGDETAATTTC